MNKSKDLFSEQSKQYASFRPTYPKELYDFIFSHVKKFDTAWDCGTGNGQVARDLAPKFKNVFATDINEKQLENAVNSGNIFYSIAGEQTNFPNHEFDLITVAQAIHWFDIPKFYSEIRRVAQTDAVLAVWGYSLLSVSPSIDKIVTNFYTQVVGSYWDRERKLIDEKYETIPFPFREIKTREFSFSLDWTLAEFQGYISTWSSVQKYIKVNGVNPVNDFIKEISPLWKGERQTVNFPLFLRLAKIS